MSSDGITMDSSDPGQKAQFACSSCRAQKKGCDKALPACSACVRLKRACKYSSPALVPVPADYQKLVERVAVLENEISQNRIPSVYPTSSNLHSTPLLVSGEANRYASPSASTFPSAFFLDVDVFKKFRTRAPKPGLIVPNHILQVIGDDLEIQTTIGSYFFSVSTWMAIISKKRIHQDAARFSVEMDADIALLVLSMKLVNEKLPADQGTPRTPQYAKAKDFYSKVESNGVGSIRLLQAGILICLYEIGHGIYPEAYLSLGHCGRLGQAIGLHDTTRIPQLSWEPGSWDEMEERRRVWWAVFILDRYINVGNPTRSLALADARRGDYLPVDDKTWEQGERVASEPLFISSSTNIKAAPFARLGQAAHLLGHVVTHINDRGSTLNVRLEEAQQLSRAILALCSFLQSEISNEATKICVPMGVCYSALILLYEWCTRAGLGSKLLSEEMALRELGTSGLEALVPEVVSYAAHIQTILPYYIGQASPLVANCLYATAKRLLGITNPDYYRALSFIKETLHKLRLKWIVAGEYLKLLDQIEASVSAPAGVQSLTSGHETWEENFTQSAIFQSPA